MGWWPRDLNSGCGGEDQIKKGCRWSRSLQQHSQNPSHHLPRGLSEAGRPNPEKSHGSSWTGDAVIGRTSSGRWGLHAGHPSLQNLSMANRSHAHAPQELCSKRSERDFLMDLGSPPPPLLPLCVVLGGWTPTQRVSEIGIGVATPLLSNRWSVHLARP